MEQLLFKIEKVENLYFLIHSVFIKQEEEVFFDQNYQFKGNPDAPVVICEVTLRMRQGDTPLAELVAQCQFAIAPESWEEMLQPDGTRHMPQQAAIHLASIGIGTARGMFAIRTEYTPLAVLPVPTVNLASLFEEGFTIAYPQPEA